MIKSIIETILISLGATSSSTFNNAINEPKLNKKQANQQVEYIQDTIQTYNTKPLIEYTAEGWKEYRKQYFAPMQSYIDDPTTLINSKPTLITQLGTTTTTSYSMHALGNPWQQRWDQYAWNITILEITPYSNVYQETNEIKIDLSTTPYEKQGGTNFYINAYTTKRNIREYFDLTTFNNLWQEEKLQPYYASDLIDNVVLEYNKTTTAIENFTINIGDLTETTYLVIRTDAWCNPTTWTTVTNLPSITVQQIKLSGYVVYYPSEVIDLPTLMFTVLTMPFTFISTAFNLTLFPGTQYQINIGNVFLVFIAILSIVFIINTLRKIK